MAYDFIIVGTGAAGSVLAERLSRSGEHAVLVLEAGGGNWHPMHLVPKGWVFTMQNDKFVRKYATEPFGDGVVEEWPRGLILGGSTTVNGLGWNTGEAPAYDAWKEAGNPEWDWAAFRAAFDAMENRKKGLAAYNPRYGRMNVETVSTKEQLGAAAIESFGNVGAQVVKDTNQTQGPRVGYASNNARRGVRRSAAAAFLRPALRRGNVTLIKQAEVTRVLFAGTLAIGVEVDVNGRLERFTASREVLVSAGSLESPLLLERSGIGNPKILEAAGVDVLVSSRKVGKNLSEHRGVVILYHLNEGIGYNHEVNTPLKRLVAGAKYIISGKGVISSGSFDVLAMLKLDEQSRGVDTQLYVAAISYGANMQPEERSGGLIAAYPMYPTSRGSIHITGPRTADKPRIIANYLDTDNDRRMIVEATRKMREVLASPELRALGAQEYYPGAEVQTDEEIVDHALNRGVYGYHTLGTCAMGPADDDVVDSRLRVRGVDGLRVIDASVFPQQPSGNNSGPTSAAAWIAADMVLQDAAKRGRDGPGSSAEPGSVPSSAQLTGRSD
jgi:choline dehydrogenase-like flavoprotein